MPEERPRVLVDTNVWISALISATDGPAEVLAAFRLGQFVPVVPRSLADEIGQVVLRPRVLSRIRFRADAINGVLAALEEAAFEVTTVGELRLCRDPKDDFLLEAAIHGRARYLVSRDDDIKRDLTLIAYLRERGVEVLSVAQFLDLLALSKP